MKRGLNLNAEERSYLITAVVVACAIAARVISKAGIAADTMGLIRSVLYIGLYFVWGISIKKRVMQAQVQRYLTAIVGMMIFWFIVRTMKYFFVADIDAKRHLWYLYYFPMLFIPLLSFFVALSLGKTEKYRLPRRALLLCIPTVCLLLFVLTNDFHEWIFRFPEGQPRSDANGMYSIGFLFVAGWEIICAVAALVLLLAKSRFSSKRKYLPAIILTCSVVYAAVYANGTRWMQVVGGDLTAVQCLFVATLLETCIACGLIPTNTGYGALFSAATMRVQIADEKYNVCYASANAPELSAELMRLAEVGDVDTGDGFLLRSSRIPGGHVLWMEDISAINELLEELESNRAEIAESNNLERENYNTKLRINALREKNRLYDLLQEQTARGIDLLDDIFGQYEDSAEPKERRKLLAKAAVVGAYIKRRGNLMFIGEKSNVTDTAELGLCLNESFANIELFGAECALSVPVRVRIRTEDAISTYDFFEEIIEAAMDDLRSVWLKAHTVEERVVFCIEVETSADLSGNAKVYSGGKTEEDVWRFTFAVGKEGAKE